MDTRADFMNDQEHPMKIPSPLVAYLAMEIGISPLVPTCSGGWVFRMESTTTRKGPDLNLKIN
jgi:hypothetical protein